MSPEEQKKIAEEVTNFFNTLPKDVVGAYYDAASKSVTIKFKKAETQPKKSLYDFLKELDEIMAKEMKRRSQENNIEDLLKQAQEQMSPQDVKDLLRSLFK